MDEVQAELAKLKQLIAEIREDVTILTAQASVVSFPGGPNA